MGKIRWYKRDPDAALNGMFELTLEERGAYNTVLDLIYSRDGSCPDDGRYIAGCLRVDLRVWRRLRKRLVGLGKLYEKDGNLRNSRADREVDEGLLRVLSAREAGRASGVSRHRKSDAVLNNNSGLTRTVVSTESERTLELATTTPTKNPPNPPTAQAGERRAEVGLKCLRILDRENDNAKLWNGHYVHQWIADGADPDKDIYPTLERMVADGSAANAGSMSYFTKAVMRHLEERRKGNGQEFEPESPWHEAMKRAVDRGDMDTAHKITAVAKNDLEEANRLGKEYLDGGR